MASLIPRKINKTKQSYLLLGPRGTGKSTWLKQKYSDALYIDLLDPENFRRYSAKPERVFDLIAGNSSIRVIIIDEIQKIPNLLNVIHMAIERWPKIQFILTGSSSRKLKRHDINLLGGRLISRTMHPFTFNETQDKISISKALASGMLPIVYSSSNQQKTLQAYIDLYIREEIYAEGLVRNLGNFTRFLEAISFSHGAIISVSSIARECEVGRKTVEGYITILCDILLASMLPIFTKKAKRHLVSHPKFYFFDTGLYQALRPKGPLDDTGSITGIALEGLVYQHLKALIEYSDKKWDIYYWRTKAGIEVDFIIYGEKGLIAIEVKLAKRVKKEFLKSLKTFKEDYPMANSFLLYMGKEKLLIDGIKCVPVKDYFLEASF